VGRGGHPQVRVPGLATEGFICCSLLILELGIRTGPRRGVPRLEAVGEDLRVDPLASKNCESVFPDDDKVPVGQARDRGSLLVAEGRCIDLKFDPGTLGICSKMLTLNTKKRTVRSTDLNGRISTRPGDDELSFVFEGHRWLDLKKSIKGVDLKLIATGCAVRSESLT